MADRPRLVTGIGLGWLVFGGLLLVQAILELIIWKVLAPAAPTLLRLVEQQAPGTGLGGLLRDQYATFKTMEAVFAAAVIVTAWQFLRLRPWARSAIQAIGGVCIAYVIAFAALWAWLWPRVEARRPGPRIFTTFGGGFSAGLVLGEFACFAIAALLVRLIVLLSSASIREAFRRPPVDRGRTDR